MKQCSVCKSEHREKIDELILAGQSSRMLAAQFGLGASSILRHKRGGHIIQALVKASEIREVSMGGSLFDQLKSLQQKALELLTKSEEQGDYRGALAAIVATRGLLETLIDVMGRLKENAPVQQQSMIGQDQIGGALQALLDSKVLALSEGEAESEDERQESVPIEDDDRDSEPVDLSEPPLQIA